MEFSRNSAICDFFSWQADDAVVSFLETAIEEVLDAACQQNVACSYVLSCEKTYSSGRQLCSCSGSKATYSTCPLWEEEVTKSALRPSLPPQQDVALPELQQSHSALGGQQAPMHTGSLEDFVLRKSLQELESPVQEWEVFPQELNAAEQKSWKHS